LKISIPACYFDSVFKIKNRSQNKNVKCQKRKDVINTSGYAVVHGRPKTPKIQVFGVTQPPGVAQPPNSRGHN